MTERIRVVTATIAPEAGGTDRRVTVRAMQAGIWIWPAFALLDAYMCFVACPGAPFALFMAHRTGRGPKGASTNHAPTTRRRPEPTRSRQPWGTRRRASLPE